MIARIVAATAGVSLSIAVAAGLTARALGARGPGVAIAAFVLVESVLLTGIFERRAPIFGRIFWRGDTREPFVAITFDDGPNEPYTGRVLDTLREFDVRATFFVVGENVKRFPESVKRAAAEGHEIGNHTFDHRVLPLRPARSLEREIARTSEVIASAAGTRPKLFRHPHGWRSPWSSRAARRAGAEPVAWTLGVWDTDRPGASVIVERTLKGLRNGCVLLLHDGRGVESGPDAGQLVEALPVILREARAQGYGFLTLSEMIARSRK